MSAVSEEVTGCLSPSGGCNIKRERLSKEKILVEVDVERFTLRKLNEMEN
jgi:hypothetical protein